MAVSFVAKVKGGRNRGRSVKTAVTVIWCILVMPIMMTIKSDGGDSTMATVAAMPIKRTMPMMVKLKLVVG